MLGPDLPHSLTHHQLTSMKATFCFHESDSASMEVMRHDSVSVWAMGAPTLLDNRHKHDN